MPSVCLNVTSFQNPIRRYDRYFRRGERKSVMHQKTNYVFLIYDGKSIEFDLKENISKTI